MARTPESRAAGQLATTTLTTLYTVPAGIVSTAPRLLLTNAAATSNQVTVIINDGSADRTTAVRTLPGGVGKSWIVDELRSQDLNAAYAVKIQLGSTTAVNYHLSASELS